MNKLHEHSMGKLRPLNSHGATVRLTVSVVISRSHGGGINSYSVMYVSMTV